MAMATSDSDSQRLLSLDSSALLQTYVRSLGPLRHAPRSHSPTSSSTTSLPTTLATSTTPSTSSTTSSLSAILHTTTLPIRADTDYTLVTPSTSRFKTAGWLPPITTPAEEFTTATGKERATATAQAHGDVDIPLVYRAALERCAAIARASSALHNTTYQVRRHTECAADEVQGAYASLEEANEVEGVYTSLEEANERVVRLEVAWDVEWEHMMGKGVNVLEGGRMEVLRRWDRGTMERRTWVERVV